MALKTITPALPWGVIRGYFNDNVGETEERLSGLETSTSVYSTPSVPLNTQFKEGDYAISEDEFKMYRKINGEWVYQTTVAGTQGPIGYTGVMWRGTYVPGETYTERDAVMYNGSAWYAVGTSTNVTPSLVATNEWELMASKGDQGLQGIPGLTWRGAWNSATSYVLDDGVFHNGSSWRALRSNTNVTPSGAATLDWAMVASKGDPGASGDHATLSNIYTVDPTDTNATRDKHVSNNDAKGWSEKHTRPTVSITAPSSPYTGQEWYDSNTSPPQLKVWTGAAWLAPRGSLASDTIYGDVALTVAPASSTAPRAVGDNDPRMENLFRVGNTVMVLTGATTLTSSDFNKLIICNPPGGGAASYNVTLPAVSGNAGKTLEIKVARSFGNTFILRLVTNGAELIEGLDDYPMAAGESIQLYCDGTTWHKIGGFTRNITALMQNTASQTAASGVNTKVVFGQAAINHMGMGNTSTSELTIKRTGLYNVSFLVILELDDYAIWQSASLKKNGADLRMTYGGLTSNIADLSPSVMQVSEAFELVEGDILTLWTRHFSSGTHTIITTPLDGAFLQAIQLATV
jgi:hypothetical protein